MDLETLRHWPIMPKIFLDIAQIFNFYILEPRYELGASIVKWTTPNPCLVFSESYSILCTNFEFVKNRTIDILKTYCFTKPKQLWWQKEKKKEKRCTYFRRWCKWWASRWCWTSGCLIFEIWWKYIKLMVFYKLLYWCPQVDYEFKEYKK